jgi:adenosylcobinamide-GDP ribazoletransferase
VTAIVVAWMLSRWAITLSCVRGVPGARPDGLGAMFAGTVAVLGAVVTGLGMTVVAAVALGTGLPGTYLPGTSLPAADGLTTDGLRPALVAVAAVAVAVGLLVRRVHRRLGGVTGDVLGAGVELALAAALVALALA